jgi:elongator complex protein 4
MSFRRRGDVVAGRGGPGAGASSGAPLNPMLNRTPAVTRPGGIPAAGIVPNRMLRQPATVAPVPVVASGTGSGTGTPTSTASTVLGAPAKKREFDHPGIKPSIVLSNVQCVSTGTKDIDTVLVHGGLPTNCSLLVEEDGSTDFSGVLVKNYVSEGIIQNRRAGKIVNHCIIIGMDSSYGTELYDVYAGGRKERKKKLVQAQEGKISVSNINASNELKIAWRYGKDAKLNKDREESNNRSEEDSKYPEYCHQFDITTTIRPSPGATEISYVSLDSGYDYVLREVKSIVDRELQKGKNEEKMIRIAIPYMLNPMVYGCEEMIDLDEVTRFVFQLRKIVASYNGKITMMASMSSELYEDSNGLLDNLEALLFDAVLRLVPFPHELNVLMEKVYKTQREKIKQGYLDVLKVPVLSGMGFMEKRMKEFAFKNSKSNFHVEPWSIPVEEEEVVESKADF